MRAFRGGLFGLLLLHANDAAGFLGKLPGFVTGPEPVDFLLGDEQVAVDVDRVDPSTATPAQACGPAPPNPVQPEAEVNAANQIINLHKEL